MKNTYGFTAEIATVAHKVPHPSSGPMGEQFNMSSFPLNPDKAPKFTSVTWSRDQLQLAREMKIICHQADLTWLCISLTTVIEIYIISISFRNTQLL